MAEVTVRLFAPQRISPRFAIDSGYGVRSNQPGNAYRQSQPGEFSVTISVNSLGMRGQREYSVDKPDDVRRVVLLGDSFVYGAGAEDEEVISFVLEDILNQNRLGNSRWEVLNLGVSGFGQAEELVTFRQRGKRYEPDIVMLFFFSNDPGNNAVSKLFEIDSNGELQRTDNDYLPMIKEREKIYGNFLLRWIFLHSQFVSLLRNELSRIVQQSMIEEQGLKSFSATSPKSDALTTALLYQLIDEVLAAGAKPIVVVIPRKSDMTSNFPLNSEDIIARGAGFIDGRDYLAKEDYWEINSHWKAAGHLKTAQQAYQVIADMLFQNASEARKQ